MTAISRELKSHIPLCYQVKLSQTCLLLRLHRGSGFWSKQEWAKGERPWKLACRITEEDDLWAERLPETRGRRKQRQQVQPSPFHHATRRSSYQLEECPAKASYSTMHEIKFLGWCLSKWLTYLFIIWERQESFHISIHFVLYPYTFPIKNKKNEENTVSEKIPSWAPDTKFILWTKPK